MRGLTDSELTMATLHEKLVQDEVLRALSRLSPKAALRVARNALRVQRSRAAAKAAPDPRQLNIPTSESDDDSR